MTTNYDGIAKEYQASKLQPWRTHVERHTLLRLTGDVRGLKTLDLACGEGSSTRLLRRLGADPVVGVDLSALKSAGLRDIRWHRPRVSPEGLRQLGEEHWRGFLAWPPIVFLECVP